MSPNNINLFTFYYRVSVILVNNHKKKSQTPFEILIRFPLWNPLKQNTSPSISRSLKQQWLSPLSEIAIWMNYALPRCQSLIFYLIESNLRYKQLGLQEEIGDPKSTTEQVEKKIDEQNKMDIEVKNKLVLGPAGWFQRAWSLEAAMGSICFSASLSRTRSLTEL